MPAQSALPESTSPDPVEIQPGVHETEAECPTAAGRVRIVVRSVRYLGRVYAEDRLSAVLGYRVLLQQVTRWEAEFHGPRGSAHLGSGDVYESNDGTARRMPDEFESHLHATWWAMEQADYEAEAHVHRQAERRARSERARAAVPPAANRAEALRRLFHKRGMQLVRMDGFSGAWAKDEWDRRRALICEGYGVSSSNDLDEGQLSAEVDRMGEAVEAARLQTARAA